jgi:hypothetical protein
MSFDDRGEGRLAVVRREALEQLPVGKLFGVLRIHHPSDASDDIVKLSVAHDSAAHGDRKLSPSMNSSASSRGDLVRLFQTGACGR